MYWKILENSQMYAKYFMVVRRGASVELSSHTQTQSALIKIVHTCHSSGTQRVSMRRWTCSHTHTHKHTKNQDPRNTRESTKLSVMACAVQMAGVCVCVEKTQTHCAATWPSYEMTLSAWVCEERAQPAFFTWLTRTRHEKILDDDDN